jgi:hypothetical protein
MTGAFSRSNIARVPMLECPDCGIRQYAATPYVNRPRCVVCDARLPHAEPARREPALVKAWRGEAPANGR